jgi:hypothetical protein
LTRIAFISDLYLDRCAGSLLFGVSFGTSPVDDGLSVSGDLDADVLVIAGEMHPIRIGQILTRIEDEPGISVMSSTGTAGKGKWYES